MFQNRFVVGICCCLFFAACIYDPGDARLEVTNIGENVITLEYGMDTIPDYPSVNHAEFYLQDTVKAGGKKIWQRTMPVGPEQ